MSGIEKRIIQSLNEFKRREELPREDEKELSMLLTENQWTMKITQSSVELERKTSSDEIVHVEIYGDSNENKMDGVKTDLIDEVDGEENVDDVETNLDESGSEYFVIKVLKPTLTKQELRFNCSSKDGSLHVHDVEVFDGEVTREHSFYDFSEELQDDIEKYLLEKGINSDFAEIVDLSLDKYDSQHCTEFVTSMENFLSK